MKYKSPTKSDPHQVEYGRRLTMRPRSPSSEDIMALLAEMGTGKSKMLLDEWQERVGAGELQNLVVFAPAGSYRNWFEDKSDEEPCELRKHLDPELLRKTIVAPWVTGGGARVRRQIEYAAATKGRPRAMFVNVEALSSVKKCIEAVQAIKDTGPTMMAVDESTAIKNFRAVRTKNIVELGRGTAARRIMTGLVTPRSPLDLFSQFDFLDWRVLGYKSFYAFQSVYAVTKQMMFGGRSVKVVVGYRNVDQLQELIAPYSYRVLKEDCLNLEPKTYYTRDVELTADQRRVYDDIKQYATSALSEEAHVTTDSVIAQILRMHQVVCGHVMDENKVVHDVKSNRENAIIEVLGEHSGKAVVWVTYRRQLEKLAAAIRKEYDDHQVVAEFHGGNTQTRGAEERRFIGDTRCRFMLSTQAAGARGNTWTVADLVIYAANSYDLELRMQSEDRCHRRGQTKKVSYVDIVARGTVEEKIIKSLRAKIDMATLISGETYREWLI